MSFRIHALLIGIVVTALRLIARHFAGTCASETTCSNANAGTHGSAVSAIDCTAEKSADDGACNCATRDRIFLAARGRVPAHRVVCILPARTVVEAELVEVFARTGKRRHPRPGRDHHAAGEQESGNK